MFSSVDGSQNVWLGTKGRLILPNAQYGHRPLAVQAIADISLSGRWTHTDSTDSHDYFPLATPHEKWFLFGQVGTQRSGEQRWWANTATEGMHGSSLDASRGEIELKSGEGEARQLVCRLSSHLRHYVYIYDVRENPVLVPYLTQRWYDYLDLLVQGPMQPTHQSHFTVHQSSKFSQPEALIFILGVIAQQSQVCSRSYHPSAMVSYVLCMCVCVHLHHYRIIWWRMSSILGSKI